MCWCVCVYVGVGVGPWFLPRFPWYWDRSVFCFPRVGWRQLSNLFSRLWAWASLSAGFRRRGHRYGRLYRFAFSAPLASWCPLRVTPVKLRLSLYGRRSLLGSIVPVFVCCVSGPNVDVPRRLPSLSEACGLVPPLSTLKSGLPSPFRLRHSRVPPRVWPRCCGFGLPPPFLGGDPLIIVCACVV